MGNRVRRVEKEKRKEAQFGKGKRVVGAGGGGHQST